MYQKELIWLVYEVDGLVSLCTNFKSISFNNLQKPFGIFSNDIIKKSYKPKNVLYYSDDRMYDFIQRFHKKHKVKLFLRSY